MTIYYETGSALLLFSWRGTAVKGIMANSLEFWALQGIHLMLIANMRLSKDSLHPWLDVDWSLVGIVLPLTSFFLVFYASTCYSRFVTLHAHCVGMGGALMEWVADVKLHFPADVDVKWNLVRPMIAALQLQYCLVDDAKSVSEAQFQAMQDNGLLTAAECGAVKAYFGYAPFLPVMWALKEVNGPAALASCRSHLQ